VEVNVTSLATGVARIHKIVPGVGGKGETAAIAELTSIPIRTVRPLEEVITTRLLSASGDAIATSETVHPLLVGGVGLDSLAWTNVGAHDVTATVVGGRFDAV
jgi:hypothetical protein